MRVRAARKSIPEAVLGLPEATEVRSHGMPEFRVRGKAFADYVVNHHGDGRVALWLKSDAATQERLVRAEPESFFIPAYVGARAWVGLRLDRGIAWSTALRMIRAAYLAAAPPELARRVPAEIVAAPPTHALCAEEIDPLQVPATRQLVARVRSLCAALPESREAVQFGCPVWQTGKKTFAWIRLEFGRVNLCTWVGVERQGLMLTDSRFALPSYLGPNGWIALDLAASSDLQELTELLTASFRHFALKRVLRLMP
jgi:hypothetical protein